MTGIVVEGWINGVSPLDCTPLERVAVTSAEQISLVVERARLAQSKWAERTVAQRAQILKRAGQHLMAHADDIARTLHRELGKPLTDCYTVDLGSAPEVFHYYTQPKNAARLLASERVSFSRIQFPHKSGVVERVPHGVVGLITPWNYPVSIPLHNLVPALLAGNAVVLKPSEYAARTGALLVELLTQVLPDGLLGIVQGDGVSGEALVRSGIEAVVFVGGARGGRAVAHAAADQLIPALLELGGKDAAIVLVDADLERAANGIAWAGLVNAGQSCAAIERIYVVASVAAPFTQELVKAVQKLRLGDDAANPGRAEIGPIATDQQLATIQAHVAEALVMGATKVAGGEPYVGPGRYYAPTILSGVNSEMALMRDETFGPILPIQIVTDTSEAIRQANHSEYGLTASIWTSDLKNGERLARCLKAGVVTINNHMFSGAAPQAAWGGVGKSGYGVQNSKLAILALTRPRLIAIDSNPVKRELWWFPYNRALYDLGRGMLLWKGHAHGFKGWRRKLLGGIQMLRGVILRMWRMPR